MPCTSPSIDLLGRTALEQLEAQQVDAQVHLRIATCNVLSLCGSKDDRECGISGPARQQMLLDQLAEEQITLFALQETRLRRLHRAHSDEYLLFRAAATARGHFGLLVGISKKLAYATSTVDGKTRTHKLAEDHVSIIQEDPRALILKVKTNVIKFVLIAGHAPHTGHSQDEIATWWQELSQSIPAAYSTWPILFIG